MCAAARTRCTMPLLLLLCGATICVLLRELAARCPCCCCCAELLYVCTICVYAATICVRSIYVLRTAAASGASCCETHIVAAYTQLLYVSAVYMYCVRSIYVCTASSQHASADVSIRPAHILQTMCVCAATNLLVMY
jgi:hypothetical protein